VSLSDRYNRGGDGRLDLLDRYLTELGDRLGNAWRDHTGVSRTTLTQSLYLFSAWASLQYVAVSHDPGMLAIAFIALLPLVGIARPRGSLVEQIQVEAMRLPRRTFVILRIWLLTLGLLSLAMAIGSLASAIVPGSGGLPPDMAENWLLGLALTALQASDYISRTNPIWPTSGGHRVS
jgi:hypothetical protein